MPDDYLEITIRVHRHEPDSVDDQLFANKKRYNVKDVLALKGHSTYLTYEVLDMIDELNRWMSTKHPPL